MSVRRRNPYKVTTDSQHNKPLFENVLNRQFTEAQPNLAYAADITCIWRSSLTFTQGMWSARAWAHE
jgi:putative transposase